MVAIISYPQSTMNFHWESWDLQTRRSFLCIQRNENCDCSAGNGNRSILQQDRMPGNSTLLFDITRTCSKERRIVVMEERKGSTFPNPGGSERQASLLTVASFRAKSGHGAIVPFNWARFLSLLLTGACLVGCSPRGLKVGSGLGPAHLSTRKRIEGTTLHASAIMDLTSIESGYGPASQTQRKLWMVFICSSCR